MCECLDEWGFQWSPTCGIAPWQNLILFKQKRGKKNV